MSRPNVTFRINDESLVVPVTEGFSSTNGGMYSPYLALSFLGTTAEQEQGYMFVSNLNNWFARLNDRIIGMQGGPTFAAGNTFYSVGKCAASIIDGTYPTTVEDVSANTTNWSSEFKPEWWQVHNFLQYGSGCYVGFKTSTITTPSSAFKDAEYDVIFHKDSDSIVTIVEYRSSDDRPVIGIVSFPGVSSTVVTESDLLSGIPSGTNSKEYVRMYGSKVHLNSTGTSTITTNLTPDVAGCIVRTDRDFYPWFSPAGARRGRILNVLRLEYPVGNESQDILYDNGVNFAVTFAGEGTLLYGDKTGETDTSTLSRINVSRLFMYVKKALAPVARSILFEQNDAITRSRFKIAAEGFLDRIVAQRGIQEYKVICDTSNNTPEVIEANQFVADILIKPITSINYVLITLTNKDLSSTL
jgi:hypothetical protein